MRRVQRFVAVGGVALAVTALGVDSEEMGRTRPGTGSTNCPACSALINAESECPECGYQLEE